MVRVRGPCDVSSVAMMKVDPVFTSMSTPLLPLWLPSTRSKQPSPSVQPPSGIEA